MRKPRNLVSIKPILSEEFLQQVEYEAEMDGDTSSSATHAVVKNGEIVGAFCVSSPTVYWWMHTKKTNIMDSIQAMSALESLAQNQGITELFFPVSEESPYNKIMEQWGYSASPKLWKLYSKVL